jgi:hypothetical protein
MVSESEVWMSRAVRLAIGFVALIPLMGIAGGLLVAAGVEGLAVGWITLGIGVVWTILVVWWALRAPGREDGDRTWESFRDTRFK